MRKIIVSDVTLRNQCNIPGNTLSFRERLNMALALEKAGVDGVELPGLSGGKEDVVICQTIANALTCQVAIPGGDTEEAVQQAFRCVQAAANPCIQIILPVSTVLMEYLYHVKAEKMLAKIAALCTAAKKYCTNVEFVARDATRAEPGFAALCCKTAADNGANGVTLCDDSGNLLPEEMAALVTEVKAVCTASLYVQPSNHLNMAAACAIAAIRSGADGIKTAVDKDSLGADMLAEILRARGESLGIACNLDVTAVHNIISGLGDSKLSISAPAAAQNQDTLYLEENCTLSDIANAVGSLGYELTEEDMGKVYEEFRRVSASKGKLEPRELEAIIATSAMQVPSTFHLSSYVVNSGNIITATAHVTMEKDGQKLSGVSTGDGPIDAAFHAIEQIIGHHYELDDFQIQSVTKGREAVGSSLIRLRANGMLYSGNGISTDIVGACIRAYINALNKIVYEG